MTSPRCCIVLFLSLIVGCTGGCIGPKATPPTVPPSSTLSTGEVDVPAEHPLCARMGEDLLTKTSTVIAGLRFYREHCPAELVQTALMNASVTLEGQNRYLMAGYLAGAAGDQDRAAAVYRKTFAGKTFAVVLHVADGGDLSVLVREGENGNIINRWARPIAEILKTTVIDAITMLGGTLVESEANYGMLIGVEIVHVSDPEIEKSFYTEHEELGRNRPPMLVRIAITDQADPVKVLISRDNGGVRTGLSELIFTVHDTIFSLFQDVIHPTL